MNASERLLPPFTGDIMADLSNTVCGIDFRNPVMPASGPNVKTAELMLKAADNGAGAVVAKTFSTIPAEDWRPTIRKTVCGGLLNCETWLEDSWENFLPELRRVRSASIPLIVSIGYSPGDVEFLGAMLEKELKPDIIEFSTHYTGSETKPLVKVAETLRKTVSVPIWMKISPGFPFLDELAREAEPFVDAFVAVNSFGPALDFDPVTCRRGLGSGMGQGWLSGPPVMPLSLWIVNLLYRTVSKPIIGVGGISSGFDAVKYLMAGASLVQVCTAAIKEGPSAYGRIASEVESWLDENGYDGVSEIIGRYSESLKNGGKYEK